MNITGMMRWVGQVAHMQEMRNAYTASVRKCKEKKEKHLEGLCIDGKKILKSILEK
jgi:hypothetical protein